MHCQRFFSAIFVLHRSLFPLEGNAQVLKYVLICCYIQLSLCERASFFNKVGFFLFNVLPYQNGVFRISPFNSSTAKDGMTCRKAAFYVVWSLLTQTTNQRFRGFVFTLAEDWQGSSLQISLYPRTVFISRAKEDSTRDRGFADRSPTLLFRQECWPKSSQGGLGFCLVWFFGFVSLLGQGCYSKEIMSCSLQSKGLWQPLVGIIRCLPLPCSPSHLPARGYPRLWAAPYPLHLLGWCHCENPPVRFSLCVDWGIAISSVVPPLLGIRTGRGRYRKAPWSRKAPQKKDCRGRPSNPHISSCCCPR